MYDTYNPTILLLDERIVLYLQSADDSSEEDQPKVVFDIMAQQLKFIACLKVAMEELATLATGFEVEGGQLRYQLYIWLEKQTEVLEVDIMLLTLYTIAIT